MNMVRMRTKFTPVPSLLSAINRTVGTRPGRVPAFSIYIMSDVQHLTETEEPILKYDLGDGKAAYRRITVVAIVLGIITVAEYFIALYTSSAVIMFILGFLKAALVVWFFMHVYRVWRGDAH